jgi:hypothetical protein
MLADDMIEHQATTIGPPTWKSKQFKLFKTFADIDMTRTVGARCAPYYVYKVDGGDLMQIKVQVPNKNIWDTL